jgi:organic radical activating enzyme
MNKDQLCSYCFTAKYQSMQKSAYSGYDENSAQDVLQTINSGISPFSVSCCLS